MISRTCLRRSTEPGSRWSHARSIEIGIWFAAFSTLLLITLSNPDCMSAFGWAAVAYGVLSFIRVEGAFLGPRSVANVSFLAFAAVPSLILPQSAKFPDLPQLPLALYALIVTQLIANASWRGRSIVEPNLASDLRTSALAAPLLLASIAVSFCGLAARQLGVDETFVTLWLQTAIVIGFTALIIGPHRALSAAALIVESVVLLTSVWSGYGRLTVAVATLASLTILSVLIQGWLSKTAVAVGLFLTPPAAIYVQSARAAVPHQGFGQTTVAWDAGLGSVISPLARASQIIQMTLDGDLPLRLGTTYLHAISALVPRDFWPEKPPSYGTELAELFNPKYARYGHTQLALFLGEGTNNFGAVGVVLASILMLASIGAISILLARVGPVRPYSNRHSALAQCWALVALAIASASIADLYWGGTFLFVARLGIRLLPIAVLMGVTAILRRTNGSPPRGGDRLGPTPSINVGAALRRRSKR